MGEIILEGQRITFIRKRIVGMIIGINPESLIFLGLRDGTLSQTKISNSDYLDGAVDKIQVSGDV
jgi:hypothetical protein